MKWIKTNSNAKIYRVSMPNGAMNIVILGMDSLEKAKAKNIGFNPSKTGSFFFREGGAFNYREIKSVFPDCVSVDVEEKDTLLVAYKKDAPDAPLANDTTPERKAEIDSKASRLLGVNYLGQEVFEDSTYRRFIRAEDGLSVFNETQLPANYLRAKTVEDISLCADAFVSRLLNNQMLRFKDVVDFATVVFGKGSEVVAESDIRVRVIQEAIEESLYRTFALESASYSHDDKMRFENAVAIEANQPVMQARTSSSVELQQFSTPLSISYAVQTAIAPFVGEHTSILEPAIGTGSLVSLFRRNQVTGYEIDDDRSRLLSNRNPHITVHHTDFLKSRGDHQYDVVVGNPPFGGLSAPVEMFEMKLTRVDHLFLMKALAQRKNNGVMSFIIASDNESSKFKEKAGQISGGSANLFNWLADHYELHAYEVDGNLYRKQGSTYNIRVVNVGKRFSESQIEANRKTKAKRIGVLPVISDYDGLWAATRESVRFFQAKSGLAEVDMPEEPKLLAPANSFQSVYQPASRIGEGSSLIPSHLQVPINKAFDKLQDEVGNIDDYVSSELGRSKDELARQFTPEQVDAIALAIWNIYRGRGLILADETGQGKGRILSAIAEWASIKARDPMFITEKAGLFSSLWRDITDINADQRIRPLLMNKGSNIIDMKNDGDVLFRTATESELREVMEGDGDGTQLLMATYSQFNRPPAKLQRSDWLVNQRTGGTLILDEAHNAAGESNQGFTISSAVKNAGGVIWSSATFAKGAKNFGVYDKAFPPSVNLESLKETLQVGGEPLLEIMSAMLCEEGTMIRRESDISKLVINSVYPSKAQEEKNIRLADSLSDILQAMASMSGEMERVCDIKTRQLKKEFEKANKHNPEKPKSGGIGLSSLNFGSRLATINRQFIMALAVPTAIEEATEAVKRGEKPIFALEQTMETLLNDLAPESDSEDTYLLEEDVEPPPVMQFRDLLDRTLTRMMSVSENNGYGKTVKKDYLSLANDEDQRERMLAEINQIRKMIADFPDLSASPVDDLIEAMQKLGLNVGEITGRKRRVVTQPDGSKVIEDIPQIDRALIEHRFGSGVLDSVVLSGAGSTGISLHSDQSFEDKRRRHLIFVQASNDIVKVKQMLGRPNRRGQVSIPAISFITSGLAAEVRLLAMRNGKFRALSAGTRSNRENTETDKSTPDILNSVGEEACRRFLMENPKVAVLAGIDLDQKEIDNYFVNKITGRISLFKQEEAVAYFNQIFGYYNEILTELTNRGENPLNPNMLDVKARIIEDFELVGRKGDSVFDSPVFAQKIEWTEYKKPISGTHALEMARKGMDSITGHPIFKQEYDGYLASFNLDGVRYSEIPMLNFKREAAQGFQKLKVNSLSKKYLSDEVSFNEAIERALADGSEAISNINEREVWFKKHLNSLTPQHLIEFNYLGERRIGFITNMTPPNSDQLHYLGKWSIDVVIKGEDRPLTITLNQLRTDAMFQALPFNAEKLMHFVSLLDSEANSDKEIIRSRWTLGGNLFKAAEISAQNGFGKSGYYTDESGVFHRAIICPSYVGIDDFMTMVTFHSQPEEAVDDLMNKMNRAHSGREVFSEEAYIDWNSRAVSLTVSGSKKTHGDIFLDEEITMRMGDFSGTRKSMTVTFQPTRENLIFVMKALYRNNLYMKTGKVPELQNSENMNDHN